MQIQCKNRKSSKKADVVNEEDRAAAVVETLQNKWSHEVSLSRLLQYLDTQKKAIKALSELPLVTLQNSALSIVRQNGERKTIAFKNLVSELEKTSGTALSRGKSLSYRNKQFPLVIESDTATQCLMDSIECGKTFLVSPASKNHSERTLKDAADSSLESAQLAFARKCQVNRRSW